MRALTLLTGLLSQLQRRDDQLEPRGDYDKRQDSGQYTQVVQGTIWTSTPTYVVSYISTQIVTLTSWVPCPVTTSYTTVYECSTCGPCNSCNVAPTTCSPKLCATQIYDVVQATTEPYAAGEVATAYVTNNNGASYTTTIPASLCSVYATLTLANYNCYGLPTCGGGVPPPVAALTCEVKPCTTLGYLNGNTYVTLTEGTTYAFTEYARLTVGNAATSTPASLCAVFTTPAQWAFAPSVACGTDGGGVITSADCTGGGGEVVTYTYTTQGSTIIVATTLPCRVSQAVLHSNKCHRLTSRQGGPFHLTGGSPGKTFGDKGRLLFYIWTLFAVVAGLGMILL